MSTKIYDGCIVKNMTTLELKNFCIRIRELIEPIRLELYHKQIARMITQNFDRHQYDLSLLYLTDKKEKLETFKDTHYWIANDYMDHKRREIKDKGLRNPGFDFDFSVCFMPIKDKLLAIVYAEEKAILDIWYAQPEVSKYDYWDNVDADESCTESEWKQREKDWDDALPGGGAPAQTGLVFEPFIYAPFHDISKVLKYITDDTKRAKALATELMWEDFFRTVSDEDKEQGKWYTIHSRFRKSLQKEKKDEFDQLQFEVLGTLRPITRELVLEEHEFKKVNYN